MSETDGAVGLVHVLAASPRRTVGIHPQVFVDDLYVNGIVDHGIDAHRGKTGMPPRLGIEWRNTMENYAHFGLATGQEAKGSELLDDMMTKIINVLTTTDAIPSDPLTSKYNEIYYDGTLRSLYVGKFHPGMAASNLVDIDLGIESEALPEARSEKQLAVLSNQDWKQ